MKKRKEKSLYCISSGYDPPWTHAGLIETGKKYGDIIIGLITDKAIAEHKGSHFLIMTKEKNFIQFKRSHQSYTTKRI